MGRSRFIFLFLFGMVVSAFAETEPYIENSANSTNVSNGSTRTDVPRDKNDAGSKGRSFMVGQYESEIPEEGSPDLPDTTGPNRDREAPANNKRPGKRILIVDCLMDGSHTHIQRRMARELASRGHNVTWLSAKILLYWPTKHDREQINFIEFESSATREMQQRNLDFWTQKSLTGELSSFTW